MDNGPMSAEEGTRTEMHVKPLAMRDNEVRDGLVYFGNNLVGRVEPDGSTYYFGQALNMDTVLVGTVERDSNNKCTSTVSACMHESGVASNVSLHLWATTPMGGTVYMTPEQATTLGALLIAKAKIALQTYQQYMDNMSGNSLDTKTLPSQQLYHNTSTGALLTLVGPDDRGKRRWRMPDGTVYREDSVWSGGQADELADYVARLNKFELIAERDQDHNDVWYVLVPEQDHE